MKTAVLLTNGLLHRPDAKTAHGLIRGPSRYRVVGVIDALHAGRDAGEVLDGRHRGIPVFADFETASRAARPEVLVVGVATSGGWLPPEMRTTLRTAAQAGLTLVSGLHEQLADDPELVSAAAASGAQLIDVRRMRPRRELHFWTGAALALEIPRVAVLGTDCALGKRTTCTLLVAAARAAGLRAEMIYTGQTGWLQGHRFGFVLDATANDFVAGELEHAVLECARAATPDIIFIEGQSALRNPAGPCGAELVLSTGARTVVLQHAPGREYFEDFEHVGIRIPPLEDEIALLGHYGARVLAITLNAHGLAADELRRARDRIAASTGLPVLLPLEEGVAAIVPALSALCEAKR
ncbi:MAG: DUF1611 domain-containing protein [Planctomycetota bacterium]